MKHHRQIIREYVQQLLGGLDVVGVYTNRPTPRFLKQLPTVHIHYGPEPAKVTMGNNYQPDEYERDLVLLVDIVTEDELRPDEPLQTNNHAENFLDSTGWEIEELFKGDVTLGRLLDDWNPDTGDGLCRGCRLVSVAPYNIQDGSDRELIAQRLTYAVPYLTCGISNTKLVGKDFIIGNFKITRDAEIDPVLIEGELNAQQ